MRRNFIERIQAFKLMKLSKEKKRCGKLVLQAVELQT